MRFLREPPVRLFAPLRRLLVPPFLGLALRLPRRAAADRFAAFAAAFLFLVRAAFLAAACLLAFEIAIVLCAIVLRLMWYKSDVFG